MSSPKHLWSGDWEQESATAQSSLPAPPPPQEPPTAPAPEPGVDAAAILRRRVIALTVVAVLVIVGVVYAVTSGGSGDKTKTGTTAGASASRQVPGLRTPTVPGVSPGTPPRTATTPGSQPPSTTNPATTPSSSAADSLGLRLALVPVSRVVVQSVTPNSLAAQVGIGAGDLLEAINGTRITSPGQAESIISKLPKGSEVTLLLVQGSAQLQATIQVSNGP